MFLVLLLETGVIAGMPEHIPKRAPETAVNDFNGLRETEG